MNYTTTLIENSILGQILWETLQVIFCPLKHIYYVVLTKSYSLFFCQLATVKLKRFSAILLCNINSWENLLSSCGLRQWQEISRTMVKWCLAVDSSATGRPLQVTTTRAVTCKQGLIPLSQLRYVGASNLHRHFFVLWNRISSEIEKSY